MRPTEAIARAAAGRRRHMSSAVVSSAGRSGDNAARLAAPGNSCHSASVSSSRSANHAAAGEPASDRTKTSAPPRRVRRPFTVASAAAQVSTATATTDGQERPAAGAAGRGQRQRAERQRHARAGAVGRRDAVEPARARLAAHDVHRQRRQRDDLRRRVAPAREDDRPGTAEAEAADLGPKTGESMCAFSAPPGG